ncbi:MAG: cupin domain-containing protein [Salinivirgaceae bacterium]|nr:cupin domain-containing protein [Salinivirgaceae bacterium]
MQHKNSDKVEVLKTEFAQGFKLANTSLHEIVHLSLEQKGIVPAHALNVNVVFYVIKGEGNLTVENDTYIAKTGDVLEVTANLQRSWINKSLTTLELLVIKQNPA